MATVATRQFEALTQKILTEVAALARDLDTGELSLRLAAQETLPIGITVQHSASFSVETAVSKGPLPPSVSALHSMEILRATLDQRLDQVRQEAGGLMDEWVEEVSGEYRSQLPPGRCARERPVLGVQQVCSGCGGRKQITCGSCGGRGRNTCSGCGGSGRVACSSCGGSGQRMCGSCGGAGGRQEAYNEYRWDSQTQTGSYVFAGYRHVPCSGCGGGGRTLLLVARNAFLAWGLNEKIAVLAVLTGISWFVVERQAQSKLKAMLGPKLYERLKGHFKKTRTRYRLLPAAGFICAWYLADFILGLIAYLRHGTPLFQ